VGEQLSLDDAAPQWAAVLARLRESVTAVSRETAAGWSSAGVRESSAPGGDPRRGGPYVCRLFCREGRTLELWYARPGATLSHELVAATCGGVATVLGCEPDRVLRFVYEGRVS
jgi:hypothetical protein